jgi:glycosyltransferase involved in cell wall biosynthesis
LKARRALLNTESRLRPDGVFTLFGPSYVTFLSPHVVGCVDAWMTHPNWPSYRTRRFPFDMVKTYVKAFRKLQWLRPANAWITQTETARQGLHRRLGFPLDRIYVVPNTCSRDYVENQAVQPFPEKDAKVRILCFAAPYPHKNLICVPSVAAELAKIAPSLNFEFVLTLPPDHHTWKAIAGLASSLDVVDRVVNLGPIALADGPALYRGCHISFLPTLLETFSATYPESMAMGLPLVAADFDFARDACGNAALYYPYRDAHAAAECSWRLLNDRELWESQIARGKMVLNRLPNSEQRYHQYAACVKRVIK